MNPPAAVISNVRMFTPVSAFPETRLMLIMARR